jgi:hypothetical protein
MGIACEESSVGDLVGVEVVQSTVAVSSVALIEVSLVPKALPRS